MRLLGFYKDIVFIINAGDTRAGLERADTFNLADCYLDNKFVLPVLTPGIVRTSSIETTRLIGQGVNAAAKYAFNGVLTIEIEENSDINIYESFSSSSEKYELNNYVAKRYVGNINNLPVSIYTAIPSAQDIITNALNYYKLNQTTSFMDFIKFINKQMTSNRQFSDYRTVHYINTKTLMDSLKRVNTKESTSVVEASTIWDTLPLFNNTVVNIELSDIAELNYSNATMWKHYL